MLAYLVFRFVNIIIIISSSSIKSTTTITTTTTTITICYPYDLLKNVSYHLLGNTPYDQHLAVWSVQ